jgi:hypothetical protein
MVKELENLGWKPMWVSHLGCIKGCLDYLKIDVSDAWLFGGTGHAFIINMHEIVCPSGPTAWNTEMIFKLGSNIGYTIDGIQCIPKSDPKFAEKQKQVWENTKSSIDKGLPCYGWELEIPEYYVVYGYDDKGYYYSGPPCDPNVKKHKQWNELGNTEIGILEMSTVKPIKPANDIKTVKDAFRFVLEHSKSPSKWIFPKYRAGIEGFDVWIKALESGKAHSWGMAYNSAVWNECRELAVEFLKEAKLRIGKQGELFDEAKKHYEVVAQNLKKVTELFPFPPKGEEVKDSSRCKTGAEYLAVAKNSEELGLKTLSKIVDKL